MLKSKIGSFEGQEKAYSSFANSSFSWKYLEEPALEKMFQGFVNKNSRVLDAGCGMGRSTRWLKKIGFNPDNIVGMDSNPILLEAARHAQRDADFKLGNIVDDKNFQTQTFDVVLSSMVLDSLDQETLPRVLSNFSYWLKENGYLILLVGHPIRLVYPNLENYFTAKSASFPKSAWGQSFTAYHHTLAAYLNGIVGAGLVIETIDEPSLPPESEHDNPAEYRRYSQYPSRLLVRAKK